MAHLCANVITAVHTLFLRKEQRQLRYSTPVALQHIRKRRRLPTHPIANLMVLQTVRR